MRKRPGADLGFLLGGRGGSILHKKFHCCYIDLELSSGRVAIIASVIALTLAFCSKLLRRRRGSRAPCDNPLDPPMTSSMFTLPVVDRRAKIVQSFRKSTLSARVSGGHKTRFAEGSFSQMILLGAQVRWSLFSSPFQDPCL